MIHRLSTMRALLLVIVLFAIPALACEFSLSTATITNAVTSKDVKGDKFDPVSITDTYPADQGKFHAVVTVSDAPSDTVIKAVWTAVDVGSAAAPNTKIDETEVRVQGSRNVDFTLTPTAGQWPPGLYKVDIYLNGKLDRTLKFSVEGSTAKPTTAPPTPTKVPTATTAPKPTTVPTSPTSKGGCPPLPPAVVKSSGIVSNVTMALGTKGDTKDPVNPTLVFQPSSAFHAVVAIQNAPKNTKFKAAWFATDVGSAADCNTAIDDTEFSADGTRNIDFTLTPSTTWPAGTYRVEIYVNGNLDRVVNFSVAGSTAPQPTAAPPTAAPQPTAPPATAACGNIPAGQGGLIFKSFYGQEILVDLAGKLYKITPNGTSETIYLAPKKYPFHAKINQVGEGNFDIEIQAGVCRTFTFSP